jgi:hypothetical protein
MRVPYYHLTRLDIAIVIGCTICGAAYVAIKWPFKKAWEGIKWVFCNGLERWCGGSVDNIHIWQEREEGLNSHEGVE